MAITQKHKEKKTIDLHNMDKLKSILSERSQKYKRTNYIIPLYKVCQ